jgi:hypothetical protein
LVEAAEVLLDLLFQALEAVEEVLLEMTCQAWGEVEAGVEALKKMLLQVEEAVDQLDDQECLVV